jgi:hypothetical protein
MGINIIHHVLDTIQPLVDCSHLVGKSRRISLSPDIYNVVNNETLRQILGLPHFTRFFGGFMPALANE